MKAICSLVLLLVGIQLVTANLPTGSRKDYLSGYVPRSGIEKLLLSPPNSSLLLPTTTSSPFTRHFMFDFKDLDDYNLEKIDPDDRESRFFEKRPRYPCPSLRHSLPNGLTRVRGNGKMVRFSCNMGFELVGSRFATCIRGRWNREVPVCVSPGCDPIPDQSPLKVKKVAVHNGSVLDLECELGYVLQVNVNKTAPIPKIENIHIRPNDTVDWAKTFEANQITSVLSHSPYERIRVFCTGRAWHMDDAINRDFFGNTIKVAVAHPRCDIYQKPVEKSMKCTFEEGLCGWFQDSDDNFDWLRNRHSTPSFLDGTGPTYDHTLGVNNSGYYLYMESSYPRVPGDKARLFSPVYVFNSTPPVACFDFWYNMYGRAIGSLKVYIKEREQLLSELTPVWELVGDQGQGWNRIELEIKPDKPYATRPFQIIFEGVVSYGHQGDIGLDDLNLKLGQKCTNMNESMPGLLTPTDSMDISNDTDIDSTTNYEQNPSSTTSTIMPPNYRLFSEVVKDWLAARVKSKLNSTTTITTTTAPTTKSSTTTISFSELQNKLKEANEKQAEQLKKLQNATKTMPIVTTPMSISTTSLNDSSSKVNEVAQLRANKQNLTSSDIQVNRMGSSHGFGFHFLMALSLLIMVLAILYTSYTYRSLLVRSASTVAAETTAADDNISSAAGSTHNGINNMVATFVRRFKMFPQPGNFRSGHENDDGEMLIIGGGGDNEDVILGSNISSINNGDSFVYDNLTDSAVYLQPNHRD